jgi:dipeptidyl aminopeptidase/acylaminoacyl peptidase
VNDDVVKVQNSILFIAALQQNKVPVETFFYAKGGHGYGMDNPTSDLDWMDSCIRWVLKMK